MKKDIKLGLFILCHHKPWLLRSSLISLFLQTCQIKYDLNFILIKGSGEPKATNKNFNEYFFRKKISREKFSQLTNFDTNIIKEIKKIKKKYKIISIQNDHGLDSGAWIKLIKKKKNMEKL